MSEATKGNDEARIVAPADLLGVVGAADLLGVDVSNIRRAVYSGRLEPLATLPEKTQYVFDRQDLLAYLREKTARREEKTA